MENDPGSEHSFTRIITVFSVSAGMVGVCLTAISLIVGAQNLSQFETICDALLVIDAMVFSLGATASFVAMRMHFRRAGQWWLMISELAVLLGLLLMVAVCTFLVFELM